MLHYFKWHNMLSSILGSTFTFKKKGGGVKENVGGVTPNRLHQVPVVIHLHLSQVD